MCLEGFCENMPARSKAYSGLKDRECLFILLLKIVGEFKTLPDYSMRSNKNPTVTLSYVMTKTKFSL